MQKYEQGAKPWKQLCVEQVRQEYDCLTVAAKKAPYWNSSGWLGLSRELTNPLLGQEGYLCSYGLKGPGDHRPIRRRMVYMSTVKLDRPLRWCRGHAGAAHQHISGYPRSGVKRSDFVA